MAAGRIPHVFQLYSKSVSRHKHVCHSQVMLSSEPGATGLVSHNLSKSASSCQACLTCLSIKRLSRARVSTRHQKVRRALASGCPSYLSESEMPSSGRVGFCLASPAEALGCRPAGLKLPHTQALSNRRCFHCRDTITQLCTQHRDIHAFVCRCLLFFYSLISGIAPGVNTKLPAITHMVS